MRLHTPVRIGILIALLFPPGYAHNALADVRAQVAPVTVVDVDPPVPDGLDGWWLAAPDVSITSDQDGTAFYSYGGESTGVQVFAGVPVYLTDVPSGSYTLSVYSVNAGLELENPPVVAPLRVDPEPPERPSNVTWSFIAGNTIALRWAESIDTASGVSGYAVYRNQEGPPFSQGDRVAFVSEPEFDDTTYPPVPGFHYAIEAWDRAGNISMLSDAIVVDVDLDPPSPPTDLAAWMNTSGWIRVSWTPAFDAVTGIASYRIYRSLDGAPMGLVGSAPSGMAYFDDSDPALGSAGSIHYQLTAVDRAGLESAPVGPVQAGVDLVPPIAGGFVVTPISQGSTASHFTVAFASPSALDSGSGVAGYEIRYGPDPDAASASTGFNGSRDIPVEPDPASLLYIRVRFYDAAGNYTDAAPLAARNVPVVRLSGQDRIGTSLAASGAGFKSADTVVFASALDYPDALCAAPLAARALGPVLLVADGPLGSAMISELNRLGTVNAFVVGGSSAVSNETFASIDRALPGFVERVAGATRYDTAARVADELGIDPVQDTRAYVVTGEKFPDALAAGPAAYTEGAPILFAHSTGVPAATLQAFANHDIDAAVILGGTASVTSGAEALLPLPFRIHGASRYDTALAFADWALDDGILRADSPGIATGVRYADGLSAGSLAGKAASPVLFTDGNLAPGTRTSVESRVFDWLLTSRNGLSRVYALGGTAVIREDLPRELWQVLSVP